jgi:uncharacterized protein YjbJ (UPF0337 family)
MNNAEFQGKWKQARGQAKVWWGKLTDDDLEKVGGHVDKFVGVMQEKYGYSRDKAEQEFNKRVAEFEATQKKSAVPAKQ